MKVFSKIFGLALLLQTALSADVILYSSHRCPYCHKVENYLDSQHKKVETKYVDNNAEIKKELVDIGHKAQVPCLVIDGYALYGSDEIIKWMKTHPERLQDES